MGNQAYGELIYRPTILWLKPLLCVAFLPCLIESCLAAAFHRDRQLTATAATRPI